MKKLIYISLFLFAIQAKSQTYIPEGRDIKLISLEGCKKKVGGLPCDSCFVITGSTGKLARCWHISEIRAMFDSSINVTHVISYSNGILTSTINNVTDTALIESSSAVCPCCTDILYFDSDTAAYYQGRVNKDEYYLSSESHMEGIGKGIYKQVPENYGWELFTTDSIYSGFGGLIVRAKNTTRVGFDAAFLGSCRVEPPAVDLQYFDSDALAIVGGLAAGETYLLTETNYYGLPKNFLKKIVEPY